MSTAVPPPKGSESTEDSDAPRVASGMVWGIKATFLDYLSRMPDAKSSVDYGAQKMDSGAYFFPLLSADEYDPTTNEGTIKFGGSVSFAGHHGFLFVTFAAPWVTFNGNNSYLSISRPSANPELNGRLPLLDIGPGKRFSHRGARAWANLPTALRKEGVELFNEVYSPGEGFDPLDIRID